MSCLVEEIFDPESVEKAFPRVLYDIYHYVVGSPYIQANSVYSRFDEINLDYKDDDNEINAYGGLRRTQDGNGYEPVMIIKRGILCWFQVSALFGAMLFTGKGPSKLRKMLEYQAAHIDDIMRSPGAVMNEMIAQFGLPTDGYFVDLVIRMFSMMVAGMMAHECGHICLGHAWRGQGTDPHGTCRNDERSADTFACSVLQSSGAGETGAVAMIAQMISLQFSSGKRENYDGMWTHPANLERVRNMFYSFAGVLKYGKVKWSTIEKVLCK
jgi:hypothetical protein